MSKCDLLITIGTSLKVQPFASLIDRVSEDCPRLLINLESVGEMDEYDSEDSSGGMFGSYREEGFDFEGATRGGKEFARDVRWLGPADEGIQELAKLLNWEVSRWARGHTGPHDSGDSRYEPLTTSPGITSYRPSCRSYTAQVTKRSKRKICKQETNLPTTRKRWMGRRRRQSSPSRRQRRKPKK